MRRLCPQADPPFVDRGQADGTFHRCVALVFERDGHRRAMPVWVNSAGPYDSNREGPTVSLGEGRQRRQPSEEAKQAFPHENPINITSPRRTITKNFSTNAPSLNLVHAKIVALGFNCRIVLKKRPTPKRLEAGEYF